MKFILRFPLMWVMAFIGCWVTSLFVPLHDHGGGGHQSARDFAIGIAVVVLSVALPLVISYCTAWPFLRRLTLAASCLWAISVGGMFGPVLPLALFGVDEVCNPSRPCRFTEPLFSITLLVTLLAVPLLVGWVLTKMRFARASL